MVSALPLLLTSMQSRQLGLPRETGAIPAKTLPAMSLSAGRDAADIHGRGAECDLSPRQMRDWRVAL